MNDASTQYESVQADGGEDLVFRHAGLVKRIAYHMAARLPASVEVEDLIQAGMVGLLEAGRQYSDDRGASFETYAGIRIRGAMVDEIRKSDWTPRSVHRQFRELSETMREIEHRTGRDARDSEVAEAAGVSLEEYHRIMQDAMRARLFSLDELQADRGESEGDGVPQEDGPLQSVEQGSFREALVRAIDSLPEREKLVMSLYYEKELNLREIGEVMEVSESRVCQIHGQAMARTRARLDDWLGTD